MKKRWSNQEIEFLKRHYGTNGPSWCAKKLCRSQKAVKVKARRMGLSRNRRSFTEKEIKYISANYAELGPIEVARRLQVKRDSVCSVARRLGLAMTSEARGKISTRTNTGRKMKRSTREKIGAANRKHFQPNLCSECGVEITRRASRCQRCELSSRSGENHNWWGGGVSVLYQMTAHNLYPIWKRPILERDGFSCRHCGSRSNLEVHHLRRFVEIRDGVLNANPHLSLDNYEDRVTLSRMIVSEHRMEDGVTLCRSCHEKCHWEKQGELPGTPNANGEGNQQPSRSNVVKLVDRKAQRLTAEDTTPDKADTSALHPESQSG